MYRACAARIGFRYGRQMHATKRKLQTAQRNANKINFILLYAQSGNMRILFEPLTRKAFLNVYIKIRW